MIEMRSTKTSGAQIKPGLRGDTSGMVDMIATVKK
jgi:hypothetical protein